ncbi:serine/threonine transporter SstT [Moraxella macacae 0408225]|uniref:Serine/threonine transporter SstT n=1 Tax=Moraxella macacae 0408225 TaxID=1230338 RepID=L2FAX9_9GAMM|nr:serine/threonine transporter SstT [Moraxella macacae]ELA09588.1 serine/threonine transporter SstT [Moraxella macacae 0408225]
MKGLWQAYQRIGLVPLIIIGLAAGAIVGGIMPGSVGFISIFGSIFVGALKAIAPLLVFVLIISSLSQHQIDTQANIRPIIILYLIGTFLAALTAVVASMLFPTTLTLVTGEISQTPPSSLAQVLTTLLNNMVSNPIKSMAEANYMGVLTWAILLGLALRQASEKTKQVISDASEAVSNVVKWVIWFAPFGVFGLVGQTVAETGIQGLLSYGKILMVLVGSMLFIALVINPLIVFVKTRKNPYPLVFTCLRESGITAFFTRSSAANIPVNMNLAAKLGLHKDTYSVAIPLGAIMNMAGAAITINVMALSAAHTLGMNVDFVSALLLAIVASLGACGASGVAGGSLLLIPLACSFLNIPDDIAMQVVAIGFIIGVVQDSVETALNSSTDVLFTAAADPAYAYKG